MSSSSTHCTAATPHSAQTSASSSVTRPLHTSSRTPQPCASPRTSRRSRYMQSSVGVASVCARTRTVHWISVRSVA